MSIANLSAKLIQNAYEITSDRTDVSV